MKKNILVLGADGMVGRAVFLYLTTVFPNHVWGTTSKKEKTTKQKIYSTVENFERDFKTITKQIPDIAYIINCIGLLNNTTSRTDLITVNALFPHELEGLAEKNNCKLIHISTDAVFSTLSGKVIESSPPSPVDDYGCSKLLGETSSKNALTFRSSFVGLSPDKQQGLLEHVLQRKITIGYSNQQWIGCTSLQFAKLCAYIIRRNNFTFLRKQSPVYHFTPLGPISKYTLIKTFARIIDKNYQIKKQPGETITRSLTTQYFDSLTMNQYTTDITKALQELINFEEHLSK